MDKRNLRFGPRRLDDEPFGLEFLDSARNPEFIEGLTAERQSRLCRRFNEIAASPHFRGSPRNDQRFKYSKAFGWEDKKRVTTIPAQEKRPFRFGGFNMNEKKVAELYEKSRKQRLGNGPISEVLLVFRILCSVRDLRRKFFRFFLLTKV